MVGGSTLRNDGKSLSFSIEQPKMIVGEWRYLRIARHGETHFLISSRKSFRNVIGAEAEMRSPHTKL